MKLSKERIILFLVIALILIVISDNKEKFMLLRHPLCPPCPKCPECPINKYNKHNKHCGCKSEQKKIKYNNVALTDENSILLNRRVHPSIYNRKDISGDYYNGVTVHPDIIDHVNIQPSSFYTPPMNIPVNRPIIVGDNNSEFMLVGQIHKQGNVELTDPYKVLPVYGKPYKGGFFNYYVTYVSGNQPFKMYISKNSNSDPNSHYSRELYHNDNVTLGSPLNALYKYEEFKLY